MPASCPATVAASTLARDLEPGNRPRAEAALSTLLADLQPEGDGRLFSEYVQSSPLCAELFTLWENLESNENGRLATSIIEALAAVLEGKFEAGARTSKTRSSIAGRIINERLQALYRYFNSERDGLLRACLRLLTAVASQSLPSASQLFRSFNWEYQGFLRLVTRRSQSEKKAKRLEQKDVRYWFKTFALAFLRWKEPALTASVLSVKGFVSTVFGGLCDDWPADTASFLQDVQDHILDLRHVPRPSKLFFFNAYTLRHLCNLLSSETDDVVQRAQELLISLCTNTFLFRAPQRQLLLDTCLHLRPLRKPQQTVVLAILQAHPSLHVQFCSKLNLGLQPVLSWQWLLNMTFIIKLLEMEIHQHASEVSLEADAGDLDTRETQSYGNCLDIIPKTVQKTLLSQALLSTNMIILFVTLQVLTSTLQRAKRIQTSDFCDETHCQKLQAHLQQSLPELNTLLLLWQKLIKEDTFELSDYLVDTDVEESHVNDALRLPSAGFHYSLVFIEWCKVVEAYCTVLPLSLLDVKFDWSKLLIAVSSQFLGTPQLTAAQSHVFEWLLACINCVDKVMHCGGLMQGMQLSKSQMAWIETMLKVRTSKNLMIDTPVAGAVACACDTILQNILHHMAVFTDEENVEACVWITQLRCRPICIPFFCFVLHLVASKPGTFASLFHDTVQRSQLVNRSFKISWGRPSLFLLVAIKQLAQKETYAFTPPQDAGAPTKNVYVLHCAQFVGEVVCQLGLWLPHGAVQLEILVNELGTWNVNREANSQSRVDNIASELMQADEHRQGVVHRLQQIYMPWERLSGSGCEDASKTNVQWCKAVHRTLKSITEACDYGSQTKSENGTCEITLYVIWSKLSLMVNEPVAHVHSAAYILLEGINVAVATMNYQNACQYLLILIEIVPCLFSARSPVLEYVIGHPAWIKLVSSSTKEDTASDDHGSHDEQTLCNTLALNVLCPLLKVHVTSSVGKGRSKAIKCCKSVVLQLLCATKFGPTLALFFEEFVGGFAGDALRTIERKGSDKYNVDPVGTTISEVISLCKDIGLLDHLVYYTFPSLHSDMKLQMIKAFVTQSALEHDSSVAFLHLDVGRRVDMLQWLVQDRVEDRLMQADMLQTAVSVDTESFFQFALTTTFKRLWPDSDAIGAHLCNMVLPLLEVSCRMNLTFRRTLVRKLDCKSVAPNLLLRLSVILAPLESSLPWLHGHEISTLPQDALCPLPAYWQLQQLILLHPSAELEQVLRKAAALDVTKRAPQARWLPLRLEVLRGQQVDIERTLMKLISSSNVGFQPRSEAEKTLWRKHLDIEIETVCCALQRLEPLSDKLSGKLDGYLEHLLSVNPESAAQLLDHVLSRERSNGDRASNLVFVARLLELRPVPDWCLNHAACWTTWTRQDSDWYRQFITAIREDYTASLTVNDRLRRHIIIAALGPTYSDAWSFRQWSGSMPYWNAGAPWSWSLDSQRVRATYDQFAFARPMVDPICLPNESVERPGKDIKFRECQPFSARGLEQQYDIGYLAPFLAGQLRTLWTEHGEDTANARRIVGPILSSIISGGVLELLLLACACFDASIRASAFECLSVIIALGSFWDDADSPKARDGESLQKNRLPLKELPQVMRLLRSTRDALELTSEDNGSLPMLPTLAASFLCACVPVLLQPQHDLYMRLGMFFLGQSCMTLHDVPLFYKMILSGNAETEKARLWMFRVIRRGLTVSHIGVKTDLQHDVDAPTKRKPNRNVECGNHTARVALAHRYVVQWLLSFASSNELSNYVVWSEAVACMVAAFADPANGLRASHRFGLCEWIARQVTREWLGPGNRENKYQAIQSLTSLLEVLAHHSSNKEVASAMGENFSAELLSLGGAIEAVLRQRVSLGSNLHGRHDGERVKKFWLMICRLSELVVACAVRGSGRMASINNANSASFSAQFSSLLQHLLSLSEAVEFEQENDAPVDAVTHQQPSNITRFAEQLRHQCSQLELLRQALRLLRVCALSRTLHSLVLCFLQNQLQIISCAMSDALDPVEIDIDYRVTNDISKDLVLVVGKILAEAQTLDHAAFPKPLHDSLVALVRVFLMWPHPPDMGWRIQILSCSLFLYLHPEVELHEGRLGELPEPETALLLGTEFPENQREAWSVAACKLLKQVVAGMASGSLACT